MERGPTIDTSPLQLGASLAKPLANRWRNRILAEVHLRPMSPKQFADEFDEAELASIARYFRELKEWGFLEVAEELRGGGRRGAVEKVYRAVQRVHFDTPTWETLPRYLRSECSGSMLEGLMLRISQAVRTDTFDAESDRHLSWKALVLDRTAWSEYVTELDRVLDSVSELEVESADRVARTGEVPFPATVGLLAFRSPPDSTEISDSPVAGENTSAESSGPHFLMTPTTAKALANPWRNRILAELHMRPRSPKQFFEEFGGPDLAAIARYFRQLRKWGYLEVAEELRGGARRGSVEKVYRAIHRVHFNSAIWEALPHDLRSECSGVMLNGLVLRIKDAMQTDTFDEETDRHLSWKAVWFDRKAWTDFVTRLDNVLAWVDELEAQSTERLRSGESEAIPATVALLAFRSPESVQPGRR